MTLPPSAIVWDAFRDQIAPAFGIVCLLTLISGKRAHAAMSVLALTVGFAVCNSLGKLNPEWWPGEKRTNWLPWLAIGAAFAGWLLTVPRATRLGHIVLATVVSLLAMRVLPKNYHLTPMWALPVFVGLTLGNAHALLRIAESTSRTLAAIIASASLLTAGGVVIFAHSKSLLDVANVTGIMFAAFAVVAWVRQRDITAVLPAAAVVLSGVLMAGYHETYSELPWPTFLLPALAPVLACIGTAFCSCNTRRTALILTLALLPLLAAMVLATQYESLAFETEI